VTGRHVITVLGVTAEEALTSGLGGAVAEALATRHPAPMRFIGATTCAPTGSVGWLMEHFGITGTGIAAAAKDLLGR